MYSQLADYEGLGKFKLKKLAKAYRIAVLAPFAPAGLILAPGLTRKAMGIKAGTKAEKKLKLFRKVAIGAAAVTGAVIAAPFVAAALPAIGSAISSGAGVVMGGLKFAGGKLMSIPSGLMNFFKSKGQDPSTLSPQEVLQTAREQGYISDSQLQQGWNQSYQGGYTSTPPQTPAGYYPQPTPEGEAYPPGGPVAEAGVAGGLTGMTGYLPWIIGGGILILMATGVAKPVTLRRR